MFERISLRVASGLLLSTAALLTACEPDECDVDFAYAVMRGGASDLFAYVWRYPTTDCGLATGLGTVGGSPFGGTSISYTNGVKNLIISLSEGALREGTHTVQLTYSDDDSRVWVSTSGGLPGVAPSGCIALLETVDAVDWMYDDHLRISGMIQCSGRLIRATYTGGGNPDTLRFSELQFAIYSSSLGLL